MDDLSRGFAVIRLFLMCAVAFSVIGYVRAAPPDAEPPPRAPAFALKTARTLYTDAEIERARANVARYPEAAKMRDGILKRADQWLEWDDRALMTLLTPASIPRAFNDSTEGCPKCGKRIFEVGGTYPWIIDPKMPFKLKCPVDGSVYPSNDFDAYYKSNFKEKKGWDTEFVDDGWGWVSPTGERHWFVAHWNHELWKQHVIPGMFALAQAYQLTGDRRYAHKAAVMLFRSAEVYPAMDHEKQSRYGQMMAARGIRYRGKISNAIWETTAANAFGQAYDAVWETLDEDKALHTLVGRAGSDLRGFIEANLLEDAVDAYYDLKISGNFGMHQTSILTLGLARQHRDMPKILDELMNASDVVMHRLGLRYALYNNIDRNGVPPENSPDYNSIWVSKITSLAPLFAKAGVNLRALPKMRSLYDGTLDIVNVGAFNPDLGDSGSVYGDPAFENVLIFESASRWYRNRRYNDALAEGRAAGATGFRTYDSLFEAPPPIGKPLPPQKPRLLDGTGLAILNNPADTVSLTLFYGIRAGHGHFDRLNFEMFGMGQPIMPDLGYPDAMNDFVPGIYTWSKNTVSHNTVVVDAARQGGNAPGRVGLFAAAPFARAVDVSALGTYAQTTDYRRAMVMVDVDAERSYFVDVFTVAGGKDHLYSLHGPPGAFAALGGEWAAQPTGTLAGEDVPEGAFYDNAAMAAEGYSGGFARYTGSGFQHLVNVRRHTGGAWMGQWAHEKDPNARLRIRVMDQPGQEVMLANARVSPVKFPQHLTYVLARREGKDAAGRFVSVLEPFKETPFVEDARLLPLDSGAGIAMSVRRNGGMDLILMDDDGSAKTLKAHGLSTDARVAVVSWDASGKVARVFFAGGARLSVAGRTFAAAQTPAGVVTSVDPKNRTIRVRLDASADGRAVNDLVGRVVHFQNDLRRTAHPIAAARRDGDDLVLSTSDDLLIGCVRVKQITPERMTTGTPMAFAPGYTGAWLTDANLTTYRPVREVTGGVFQLAAPMPDGLLRSGEDAWVVDVGPGDRLDAPPVFTWTASGKG